MAKPLPSKIPGPFAKLIAFLAGKKTYLVAIAGVVYAVGIKYWDWPNDGEIWAGLGFTTAATLRAAIAKLCIQFARPGFVIRAGDGPLDVRLLGQMNEEIDAPSEAARRHTRVPSIILAASLPFFLLLAGCQATGGRLFANLKGDAKDVSNTSYRAGGEITFRREPAKRSDTSQKFDDAGNPNFGARK